MKRSGKPGIWAGAVVGAMLTAALIGVFYAAWQLAGLPFVPFDVFDWLARVLPGRIIAFGIGSIVAVIRALHIGPTSVVAKMAEQAMGIAGLFFTGMVAGAALFGTLRALRGRYALPLGFLVGIVVGVPVLLISRSLSHTTEVTPIVAGLWILATFIFWGAALGWTYRRLLRPGGTVAAGAPVAEAPTVSAERLDRRQFLIQLGGATAVITVVGAIVGTLAQRRRGGTPVASGERWSTTHSLPNAGARGISRVEVQVDEGPWRQAALRAPLSELTWVLWRYDWPFQPGRHTFTVRCYDGSDTPQIVTPAPPEPSGAAGLHSVRQHF